MSYIRSFLFIPADSEKKLSKADNAGADAIILDLEDSVALGRKGDARELCSAFLKERPHAARPYQIWVRVNPVQSGFLNDDLDAVLDGMPDGIVFPKPDLSLIHI